MVAFRNLASESGPHFTEEEVQGARRRIRPSPTRRVERRRAARAARPTTFPPAPPLSRRAIRRTCRWSPRRAPINRGFPTFVFDIFTQYQETGPDYIHSLLTGYQDPPAGVEVPEGLYYNPYFISGVQPRDAAAALRRAGRPTRRTRTRTTANDVPETVDQYAKDVTAFLMWAAEPHLVDRKAMGLTVMVFLVIFAGLVYYTKKKVWAAVPGEA